MNRRNAILSLAATAALALGTLPALAASDAHQHGTTAAPASLALDHGRKWPTDAPLRQRMGEIRALMADRIPAIHAGKLSTADYRVLGAAVEQKVAAIVAECKLPPEADAMLHVVVADLLEGADIMQGKAGGAPGDGAHKVVAAANNYGRYFDHRGWKRLG